MGRKSKAKIRRQEILSHFYEVIIEEGFEGASIGKIAKRMEVNPSLLIHYFSTKMLWLLA
ncbi:MAG: TetR/AcrR family transcriptional regulator [Bacteroidia bacterium]